MYVSAISVDQFHYHFPTGTVPPAIRGAAGIMVRPAVRPAVPLVASLAAWRIAESVVWTVARSGA